MKILLIIPAYNEEESIINTIKEVENFRKNYEYDLDYIVINDGSTDNTEQILIKNKIKNIKLVINLGIGGAVQTGYKYAYKNQYDIAIQFDGDGQHDINSIDALIAPILAQQADLVVGSRFLKEKKATFQTTVMRKLGIKIISFFIKIVANLKIYDTTSGYRAANRKTLKIFSRRYPSKFPEPESIVVAKKKGLKIIEQPVNMFERQGGESSITPLKSISYMVEVCSTILISILMKEND